MVEKKDGPLFKITAPWGQWKIGTLAEVTGWLKVWGPLSNGKTFAIQQISA